MAKEYVILHPHGNYGPRGQRSYILIQGRYKSKDAAKAAATSSQFGDVVDAHRIVEKSRVKPVVIKGKKVKALYHVGGVLSRFRR